MINIPNKMKIDSLYMMLTRYIKSLIKFWTIIQILIVFARQEINAAEIKYSFKKGYTFQ
jgi:hypothetical protein